MFALKASSSHGLIGQSVRASEHNSVVVGSNPNQENFLQLLLKIFQQLIRYLSIDSAANRITSMRLGLTQMWQLTEVKDRNDTWALNKEMKLEGLYKFFFESELNSLPENSAVYGVSIKFSGAGFNSQSRQFSLATSKTPSVVNTICINSFHY